MSESAWQRCCVCSTHFDAVDPARPLLYRCVTCSDLSTVVTSTRNVQDCCLHICSKCYGSADLYHPSSHSWAKVFISNVKGYYQYKKADEWIDKVRIAATSLNQVKDDIFPTLRGLETIYDVCHYMPCHRCQAGIYGTRFISLSTQQSFCESCYLSGELAQTEEVWFMRKSIFMNLPHNGPLLPPPKPKEATNEAKVPPKPAVPAPIGFGAPKQPALPVSKPGENYSDYQQTYDQDEAPAPGVALIDSSSAPAESYVDTTLEDYQQESALNLKKASSYYDDDDDEANGGYGSGGYYGDGAGGSAVPSGVSVQISKPPQEVDPYADDEDTQQESGYGSDGYYGQSQQQQKPAATVVVAPPKQPQQPPKEVDPYVDDEDTQQESGYGSDGYYGQSEQQQKPAATVVVAQQPPKEVDPYADDEDAQQESGYGSGGYYGQSEQQPKPAVSVVVQQPQQPAKEVDPYADDEDTQQESGYGSDGYYGQSEQPKPAVSVVVTQPQSANTVDPYADEPSGYDGYSQAPESKPPASANPISKPTNLATATPKSAGPTTSSTTAAPAGYQIVQTPFGPRKVKITAATIPSSASSSAQTEKPTADPFESISSEQSGAYGESEIVADTPGPDDAALGYSDLSNSLDGTGYTDPSSQDINTPQRIDPFETLAKAVGEDAYGNSNPNQPQSVELRTSVGYAYADPEVGGYSDAPVQQLLAPQAHPQAPEKANQEAERDWNQEFQIAVAEFSQIMKSESPDPLEVLMACHKLYSISADFIQIAQEIGRIIIEEVSIPAPAKTIKPANAGGVAGGEKYIQKGVFFKFAIDAFGVYGGDEYAQKAAGHELAGLKAYYNCQIEGLNTPFMLLMDYRGYRLIATTKLPIGGNSLIYGSADGGITIHKDDPVLNAMMEKAAKIINIKPHVVGMRNQTDILYAPTDIEGHKGNDGRYYVLDTARICPPEPIHKSFTAIMVPPENPFPKTVESFRMWIHNKKPAETSEFWSPLPPLKEIGLTTERWIDQINAHLGASSTTNIVSSEEFGEGLLYHLKPATSAQELAAINVRASNLVKKLIRGPALLVLKGRKGAQLFNLLRYEAVKASPVPLSSDAFTPFGRHNRDMHNEEVENTFYRILSETIPKFLTSAHFFPHASGALKAIQHAGINTRLIGFLRSNILDSHPNSSSLRTWLLNEMVVRVTKNYIRNKLRKATSELKPIEPIIIERFNLLLGDSVLSTAFWTTELKAQIANKFGRNGQALTPAELRIDVDLRKTLNKLALFQYLQSRIGVLFTEEANARFQIDPSKFEVAEPLSLKDLAKLEVLQKSLLQPDLDSLIIRTATQSSSGNAQKMLETLANYLPSQSHPALALQRLHIVEQLLIQLFDTVGNRFLQNAVYSSNAETLPTNNNFTQGLRNSVSKTSDKHAIDVSDSNAEFLNGSVEFQQVLAHLEVLRQWVENVGYCPLEISVKLWYLRGCISMLFRMWNAAEAYFRTAYDCLTKIASIPKSKITAEKADSTIRGVTVDNDRPFSLLVLDKLITVLIQLNRPEEALAYAEKWVAQFSTAAFPGSIEDLKLCFGKNVPVAFTIIRSFGDPNRTHHIRECITPWEKQLISKLNTPAAKSELDAWIGRISLTNFEELSGFFLSPGVLQQYMEAFAYRKNIIIPRELRRSPRWAPTPPDAPSTVFDQVIRLPPVLTAGIHDLEVFYHVNKNRLAYSKSPHRLLLIEDMSWENLLQNPGMKIKLPMDRVIAEYSLEPNVIKRRAGVATFRQVKLKPGSYLALAVDGQNDLIGSTVDRLATQSLQVISADSTSKLMIGNDRYAGWWSYIKPFTSLDITAVAMHDDACDNHDGKDSDVLIYATDTSGKVWKNTTSNYLCAPPGLTRAMSRNYVAPTWSLFSELAAWKVTDIAVSRTHTLILTDNGELLSMGENAHGALGHGDTVSLSDPRLVRKLKGKSLAKIYATQDRSAVIDEAGQVYQWGLDFTTLPELHPYFSGKSADSKGNKIPISKIEFHNYIPIHKGRYGNPTDFFKGKPICYVSTTGRAYLWCADKSLFPEKSEYTPEPVMVPSDPIVDVALGSYTVAFLTAKGEVWTAGSNEQGELGVGIGTIEHVMERKAFKWQVPYSCAKIVSQLVGTYIVQVGASMDCFYALSDAAELYSWGGGRSWVPRIEVPLQGLKVERFGFGKRGMIALTNQNLTVPLPHHLLSYAVQQDETILDSKPDSAAPATPDVAGSQFSVVFEQLSPKPDFKLLVTLSKTELGETYFIRIVKPGETEAAIGPINYDVVLPGSDQWEYEAEALYSTCRWGVAPWNEDRNPPFGAGDYQCLILHKANNVDHIVYRSATFTIAKSDVERTIKFSPAMPRVKETITFHLSPISANATGHYLIIRNKSDNMMCGCIPVDKETLTYEHWAPAELVASWEHTFNPSEAPIETFASVTLECGTPKEERPQIELEFIPAGPYYKGQPLVLSWKYLKNPPPPGSQFFGAIYLAEQKGMTAIMQGGYANVAESSGTASFTLPAQRAKYEYRVFSVSMTEGMSQIYGHPIDVEYDEAPAPTAEPEPEPEPEPTIVDSSDNQTSPVLPTPVNPVSVPNIAPTTTVVSYSDWDSFFAACGFDRATGAAYSKLASVSNLPISKLEFIDGGILQSMKITTLNHQLMILEKIQTLKDAKLHAWVEQRIQEALALVPESLD